MLARFWNNRDGAVAPMLAIASLPLLIAVGTAVDFSRINSARTAFQVALDSTALNLTKNAQGMDPTALDAKASDVFNALFTRPEAHDIDIKTSFTSPKPGSFDLTLTGSVKVDTIFGSILGQKVVPMKASSTVEWGIKKLNLALVLDNTGSMGSSGKMDALKTAAHNLLTTLQAAATNPGDVTVSIVPFATDVNVGPSKVGESWISWSDWENSNGSCSYSYYKTQSSCVAAGKTWTVDSKSTWNGCVYDRDQNYDVQTDAPVSGSTLFPAHQASACPTEMLPLTEDWTALNSKIDAMSPSGKTNITIGMAWGWQTLKDNAPLNAPPPDDDLEKVIVLLTDGDNTENRWTSSSSSIDARTQQVCTNVKAAGVKVYTIRVVNGNAALLQSCASKASMYYNVTEASQLNGVFTSIADNLANLRLVN